MLGFYDFIDHDEQRAFLKTTLFIRGGMGKYPDSYPGQGSPYSYLAF
jgi:hypothetical protein